MIMRFKNKKILVMGLGLLGGGISVVKWFYKKRAKITITDLKIKKELVPSLKQLKNLKKIKYVLGRHRLKDFKKIDLVIQNPAVPKESKYLKIAQKAGIPIENEASLFFKLCPAQIIGVTGTRGKSTVATLIYELLKMGGTVPKRGQSPIKKVWLAGLPQKPMLEILDKIRRDDLVVLELSSWQLEILGQQKLSPHIAVITNIYPDHLNRYLGMKEYISAKKNIFKFQTRDDFVVLNKDNSETKKMGQEVFCQRFWFSRKYFPEENGTFIKKQNIYFRRNGKIVKLLNCPSALSSGPKGQTVKLPGEHNLENILAAVTVAMIYQVKPAIIKKMVKNFKGLADRLELVKITGGVKYYNDTTATTPEATIAALHTLSCNMKHETCNKKIILLAGGSDKKLDFKKLIKEIKKYCKALVLLKGKGTKKIKKLLQVTRLRPPLAGFGGQASYKLQVISYKLQVTEVANMLDAVSIAQLLAKRGDIVLLSPACASFGIFLNEFDRGNQFKEAVKKLI